MEIKTPDLGVDSAEVSELLVDVGDVIEKDDNIVVLESDKASVEVPSSHAGKVTNLMVSVGDQVSEGVVLIEVEPTENKDEDGNTENESTDNSNSNEGKHIPDDVTAEPHDKSESHSKNTTAHETTETTYALPDLGVEEAQVAEVMVAEGEEIAQEQSILLIESDKASVEVPAPVSGKIIKLLVSDGDTVKNGQDYIVIASNKAVQDENQTSNETKPTKQNDDQEDKQNKNQGYTQNDENKNISSSDANKNSNSNARNVNSQMVTTSKLSEQQVNEKLTDVYAGPAVRKLARKLGIDITNVSGSAVNNRIVKEDLFDYVKSRMSGSSGQSQTGQGDKARATGLPNLPDMSKSEIWGELETQELSRLQKVSIPQLTYNTYLPQVTQFDLADITDTESLRGELKVDFKKQGIGLTILAFIVKATAYALTQYPRFNSHLSDDNSQIILRKTVNMGIAVATDDGLIVPVIKDAQDKGIKQIAIEIGELATKARDKKLSTKELQGASFTISSQGNLGGTYFTPLVNWPQVGILGVSEATMQPRWQEDSQSFKPRLMLPLSLSYDHRVINGADAAVFTRYVATLLADPRRILL